MPTLTVKTEYITKLKSLGVYELWFHNLKCQWDSYKNHSSMLAGGSIPNSWKEFISKSFSWKDSVEGSDMWVDIGTGIYKS